MSSRVEFDRRSFLKVSTAAAGGLVLSFGWKLANAENEKLQGIQEVELNGHISVSTNGVITIQSTNPEIGQNVKTSMPMIIAEELDADFEKIIVEQAPLNTDAFTRQVAGGSQSIRKSFGELRKTGATARQLLLEAAAKKYKTSVARLKTNKGQIILPDGKKVSYGDVATEASRLTVPQEVQLKNPKNFSIIGKSQSNVDSLPLVMGKPLFGIDTKKEGMLYACALRSPAIGKTIKSFDDTEALKINGVKKCIKFSKGVAVLATSTWAAMQGQRLIRAEWNTSETLESTSQHDTRLNAVLNKAMEPKGKSVIGDVNMALDSAEEVIESVYEAPFLPHNTLEPMNFYANVTSSKVELIGPTQTPEGARKSVSTLLGRSESQITIQMTRIGGGFGRRLKRDYVEDAAEISDKAKAPVQLIFTREDDMTGACYRPATKYKFKAGLKRKEMTAYHIRGAAINSKKSVRERNFPFRSVDNYLADADRVKSNIETSAWRAPTSNFLAFSEQSFIDEVAHKAGKDPVQFRLDLFQKAKIGKKPGYDVLRFENVLKLVVEKSEWSKKETGIFKGVSMYYSHNSYVAQVAKIKLINGSVKITEFHIAVDCGMVINPTGADQQAVGGAIDGLGHAMFGEMLIEKGSPQSNNFNNYRMIRMSEAPKVYTHFVDSDVDPTGMGEPTLPPAAAALANAIFMATGKRLYKQPFVNEGISFV